jgi:hypothetical protein
MASPQIPFLPGYPSRDYARTNFNRVQLCNVRQGTSFVESPAAVAPIVASSPAPPRPATADARRVAWAPAAAAPAREPAPPPVRFPSGGDYRGHAEIGVPAGWTCAEVAQARELQLERLLPEPPRWATEEHEATLSFGGYFREAADASASDTPPRIRVCTLTYHVGDGTALVYERPQVNSGIPQGVLLKRHRIRKPTGAGFYGLADLNVGVTLDCYGRHITLVSCDAFSRAFLHARGIAVAPDEPPPRNPPGGLAWPPGQQSKPADEEEEDATPPRGAAAPNALQRFLQFDRVVLRFYLLWQEGPPLKRQRRLVLNFFLADGTAEIHEEKAALAEQKKLEGTDTMALTVGRQLFPLKYAQASAASFGVRQGERALGASDLAIGAHVDVFGRSCLIYDADGATRAWCAESGRPLAPALFVHGVTPPAKPPPTMPVPPHSGFGSEEDSLASVRGSLIPRALPRRDIFRTKPTAEPGSLDVGTRSTVGLALRFSASLARPRADDLGRRFVVTYFLDDGTAQVYEAKGGVDGHPGGMLLERVRAPRPAGGFYAPHHFAPGATIDLYGRRLVLVEPDAFTARYLAERASALDASRDAEATTEAAAAAQAAEVVAEAAEAVEAESLGGGARVDSARVDRLERQLRSVLLARSAQIRNVFRRIDKNADGRITLSEFAKLLNDLHFELDADVRA